VHAFEILGDPVRRQILELVGSGELSAGVIGEAVQRRHGISQPAVSQHLRVLRRGQRARRRTVGEAMTQAGSPAGRPTGGRS
jgi:hypothetical protein